MPTTSGHTRAILASKVKGTTVYSTAGDKIGHVEDVVLDKTTNQIMFAALGFGGMFGIGEKYAPVPWSVLDYVPEKRGYVVPISKDTVNAAPLYDMSDLVKDDGLFGDVREKSYAYYNVARDW